MIRKKSFDVLELQARLLLSFYGRGGVYICSQISYLFRELKRRPNDTLTFSIAVLFFKKKTF